MRSHALRSAAIRIGALRLILLALFLVLAARAGQLTVISTEGRIQGDRQLQTRITQPSARGLILDRDRSELAISLDAPSIYVMPKLLEDRSSAARDLAKILKLDRKRLEKRINSQKGFTYVARWVTGDQAERVAALNLSGVGIEREPRRRYPAGKLAASLLGFADIDGKGVRGVEQMLDEWLRGRPRTLAVTRDARGKLLSRSSLDPRETAGGDVVLSIDAGLQAEAESALEAAAIAAEAKAGLVISIDPRTGDILSLAEYPRFDPNHFRNTDYAETRSRSFVDLVEPGSTFKAFLVAAALEAGVLDPNQVIDTGEGWMRVPGKTIRDHRPYGILDPTKVLQVSSNVGSIMIAQMLGPEAHHAALRRFGFGDSTGSRFPGEVDGLLRDWRRWREIDHATVAFGQGVSITSIQLAMALAALANGGELMQPRLVLARRRTLGEWQTEEPVSLGNAVSRKTAERVLGMMESVVSAHGTAGRAALAGVRVAGKTGTAQKLDSETGSYSQTRYTAWFMGVAPADDPRLAIVVALDEPGGKYHTGGAVAAPLFARVAAAQLAHQGILTRPEPIAPKAFPTLMADRGDAVEADPNGDAKPMQNETIPVRAERPLPAVAAAPPAAKVTRVTNARTARPVRAIATMQSKPTIALAAARSAPQPESRRPVAVAPASPAALVLVPDFQGQSLGRARRMAERESLELQVLSIGGGSGEAGAVVGQSPAPGTILDGGSRTVIISLATRAGER